MMSISSRRELLAAVGPRYRQARGQAKEQILDEFVASTGYSRKHAIALLNHPPEASVARTRRRPRVYPVTLRTSLERLWRLSHGACGKRLVVALPGLLDALERHGALDMDIETRRLLTALSAATADRLLATTRRAEPPRRGPRAGRGPTAVQQAVPIRRWSEWDACPIGTVQIDLVHHSGPVGGGDHLYTLTLTDVASAWTEQRVLPNRSQHAVHAALDAIRATLPFPLVEVHSDNGTEFLNDLLYRYATRIGLRFTRGRPHHSNDQAHVEQKNGYLVRGYVGYDRYAGDVARTRLTALYVDLRAYVNAFLPTLRVDRAPRTNGTTGRRYRPSDTATPVSRLLAAPEVAEGMTRQPGQLTPGEKDRVRAWYATLNPATLDRAIATTQTQVWDCAVSLENGDRSAGVPPTR